MAPDAVAGVNLGILRVIPGKEDGFILLGKAIPYAARAVAAAPPLNGKALKRSPSVRAERLQRTAVFHGEGQLPQGFLRGDHRSLKAVFPQPGKRAGVVGMGMGQKHGLCAPNLLRRQMGIRILRRIRHFSTVHQKAAPLPLHIKAVSAVLAYAAGNQQLHVTPPSFFPQIG